MSSVVSVRLSDTEKELLKDYADNEKRSLADMIRILAVSHAENEYLGELADQRWRAYLSDSASDSLEEVAARLGVE